MFPPIYNIDKTHPNKYRNGIHQAPYWKEVLDNPMNNLLNVKLSECKYLYYVSDHNSKVGRKGTVWT